MYSFLTYFLFIFLFSSLILYKKYLYYGGILLATLLFIIMFAYVGTMKPDTKLVPYFEANDDWGHHKRYLRWSDLDQNIYQYMDNIQLSGKQIYHNNTFIFLLPWLVYNMRKVWVIISYKNVWHCRINHVHVKRS